MFLPILYTAEVGCEVAADYYRNVKYTRTATRLAMYHFPLCFVKYRPYKEVFQITHVTCHKHGSF